MTQKTEKTEQIQTKRRMRIDHAYQRLAKAEAATIQQLSKDEATNLLEVQDRDDGVREIRILNPLGPAEMFFTTDAEVFAALEGATEVNIVLSSPGGFVTTGRNIATALRRFKRQGGTVNVDVGAVAGSAATYLLAVADEVRLERDSQIFIHRAEVMAIGNRQVMEETIEALDRIDEELINLYSEWTGNSREQVGEWLIGNNGEGTTFTAEEAVQYGFADRILDDPEASAEPAPEIPQEDSVEPVNEDEKILERDTSLFDEELRKMRLDEDFIRLS